MDTVRAPETALKPRRVTKSGMGEGTKEGRCYPCVDATRATPVLKPPYGSRSFFSAGQARCRKEQEQLKSNPRNKTRKGRRKKPYFWQVRQPNPKYDVLRAPFFTLMILCDGKVPQSFTFIPKRGCTLKGEGVSVFRVSFISDWPVATSKPHLHQQRAPQTTRHHSLTFSAAF